jgi:hypothetical protein
VAVCAVSRAHPGAHCATGQAAVTHCPPPGTEGRVEWPSWEDKGGVPRSSGAENVLAGRLCGALFEELRGSQGGDREWKLESSSLTKTWSIHCAGHNALCFVTTALDPHGVL